MMWITTKIVKENVHDDIMWLWHYGRLDQRLETQCERLGEDFVNPIGYIQLLKISSHCLVQLFLYWVLYPVAFHKKKEA